MAGDAGGITHSGSRARSNRSALTPAIHRILAAILVVMLMCAQIVAPISAESDTACVQNLPQPTSVTSVHVQPDDGVQPVLDEINFAACTIDLSMYIFTNQEVFDALEHAVARGISVRVILEREPFGSFGDQQEMFDRLEEIGAEVRWGPDEFTYSHAKYMVVDSSVLIVTNQNFTNAGFDSNREFGLVTTEQDYVQEAGGIFEADWERSREPVHIEHLVVSPINSRDTILAMLENSQRSIWMYSEVLRDEEITDALSSAAGRGVEVRILVNPSADEDDAPYFLDALEHGVQIRVLRDPYVHSKLLIVDGEAALLGSQNYSYTSLDLNREVGIVLTDDANLERMTTVYSRDWQRGEPVDTVTKISARLAATLTRTRYGW